MSKERRGEIRCICGRKPLLAMFGTDDKGKPFIHVKIYKQARIYGELWIAADAEVKIRCRECLRVQKIKIISGRPLLEEEREMMNALEDDSAGVGFASHHPQP